MYLGRTQRVGGGAEDLFVFRLKWWGCCSYRINATTPRYHRQASGKYLSEHAHFARSTFRNAFPRQRHGRNLSVIWVSKINWGDRSGILGEVLFPVAPYGRKYRQFPWQISDNVLRSINLPYDRRTSQLYMADCRPLPHTVAQIRSCSIQLIGMYNGFDTHGGGKHGMSRYRTADPEYFNFEKTKKPATILTY